MADRTTPLATFPNTPTLKALPPATRISLRSTDSTVFGFGAPINRAVLTGPRAALHLGPDEWLVIAPEADAETLLAGASTRFASAVDVSHRNTAIQISGPHATEILAAFIALDLALPTFPIGTATRTLLGKAEIILWRTDTDTFHIEVWRSFAPYVWNCLLEAGREFA
jgi:sarcosine oxidase subunit gamma